MSVDHDRYGFTEDERRDASALIAAALAEDWASRGDITSQALLDPSWEGSVTVTARAAGVIAGLPLVPLILERADATLQWIPSVREGSLVEPGDSVGRFQGRLQTLLALERTILNFLTHLSGVATLTARCVAAARGTRARILDTRKTLPGWRRLQKYAVRVGGGENHRMGLFDAVLIKDNHIAAWRRHNPDRSLAELVRTARQRCPQAAFVEIEVDDVQQLADVLAARPDIVLLDNFSSPMLVEAVRLRDRIQPTTLLEASGGITLETIGAIARTGVDRISVGALTHSPPAMDLAFDWS